MTPVHLFVLSLDQTLINSTPSEALTRHQANAKFFAHTTILILNSGKKYQPSRYDKLDIIPVNAWGKIDLLSRAFSLAQKIYKYKPYQLITCEDPLITARVGQWLKAKLHIPLNLQNISQEQMSFWKKLLIKSHLKVADSTIAPIAVNLGYFYKPAHFHSTIKKFISIGKLVPSNKYADLLDGFSQITKAHPESTLTIIGDGPEKSILASHIINLGLNDRIFLLGEKSPKDTAALLHQHDVFIFTSESIGWGEIISQAQASGLPIITSPTKDGEDILQPNTNCLMATDIQSLVSCFLSLIDHPEDAYRLAKNGQQWLMANLESTLLPKYFSRQILETINQK